MIFTQICQNLADHYIVSSFKRKQFLFLCWLWYHFSGIAQSEKRINSAFAKGEDGFFSRVRRDAKSIFYPERSASFFLDQHTEEPPAKKAAKLIVGTLRLREKTLRNELEPEFEAGKALEMNDYCKLFSQFTAGSIVDNEPHFEIVDAPPSEHIIISIDGVNYKLQVIKSGQILPIEILYNQISSIIADAKEQLNKLDTDRFPLGLFTAYQNEISIKLFNEVEKSSPDSVKAINEALFFLAIDIHHCPQSLDNLGRTLHIQNFHNRDFRHTMQIVVTANGLVSLIVDPIVGLGGTISTHFLDLLNKECEALGNISAESNENPNFERLKFNQALLVEHREAIFELESEIKAHIYPQGYDSVFRLEDIGTKNFSACGVSADAAFHAALSLAYKRLFGRAPTVCNFINLRSSKFGGFFRYNSVTPELENFIDKPNATTFGAFMQAHKSLVKHVKSGHDSVYLLSNLLYSAVNHNEISEKSSIRFIKMLNKFIPGFSEKNYTQNIWASNIRPFSGFAYAGRPGVLDERHHQELGGHYIMFSHHMILCFISQFGPKTLCGQERILASTIRTCLKEIEKIANSAQAGDLT